jgi:hypothetical protein
MQCSSNLKLTGWYFIPCVIEIDSRTLKIEKIVGTVSPILLKWKINVKSIQNELIISIIDNLTLNINIEYV